MDTAPAHIIASRQDATGSILDEPPFVDRVAAKVHQLAAVKPALVRLLEWQIDEELERAEQRPGNVKTGPASS